MKVKDLINQIKDFDEYTDIKVLTYAGKIREIKSINKKTIQPNYITFIAIKTMKEK